MLPTALVGVHASGDSFPSGLLSRAVSLAFAPQRLAGVVAASAGLLALMALVVRVRSPFPGRHRGIRPVSGTSRMPD